MTDLLKTQQKLEAIFNKYARRNTEFDGLLKRKFVFPIVEKKSILFAGINPSYTNHYDENRPFYEPKQAVEDYSQYFRVFSRLASEIGETYRNDWTYTDLFYFRETDQKCIGRLAKQPLGAAFMWDQLLLTETIMENLQPRIIVVCNAEARNYLGKEVAKNGENSWLGFKYEFDSSIGLYRITGYNEQRKNEVGSETPLLNTLVCFTSTLKYMDKYSKERLAWQIKCSL